MDWPSWLDDINNISVALDIWRYVNPDSKDRLSEPEKPALPTRPKLKQLPAREQYETDKTYDLRVEQDRHAHLLSVREYDVLYEQYRMDCAKYLASLAVYTAAKDDLQKLYRIIFRSIPERYRAYLRLDGAETPRDMLRSLRSRIHPPSDRDRAPIAQRQFDGKLTAQPTDDKESFIEAIALAAVELHRLKASTFDEGVAVKELIRSLQTLDKPFADAWSRRLDAASGQASNSVLDIVEEFKYKMRMQDDKPYLKELSEAAPAPAPAPNTAAVVEPESLINLVDEPFDLPIQNHVAKHNGVDQAKPSKKVKKAREDAVLAEQPPWKPRKPERESTFNEKPAKFKKKSDSTGPLAMQICPGCQLRHLIRGDAWWESCYVYYELSGLGNVPEHFTISAKKLDLAYSRLEDYPDEYRRAQEWANKKTGATGANGANGAKEQEPEEFTLW